MAKSIRQLILENIETVLAAITTNNGYHMTFKKSMINRSAINLGRELEWPSILIGASDEAQGLTSAGPNHDVVTRRLTVELTLGLAHDNPVLPTQVEEAIADIIKAMALDHTRGGHALTTDDPEIREPTFSQVIEGHAFVTLSYPITYCHRRTDATLA